MLPADPNVVIVGVGLSDLERRSDRTSATMGERALSRALADAGMRREQIDGLVCHIGSPRGMDYDTTAAQLGLSVDFAAQPWSHGRFAATVIMHGAMAIRSGLATYVLCLAAFRNSNFGKHGDQARPSYHETLRPGGGPHGEQPFAGFSSPVIGAAMATRRYLHRHAIEPTKLAAVSISQRACAALNSRAVRRDPIDMAQYLEARLISSPLCLLDCSFTVDGAAAIILARGDRAADHDAPIRLAGFQGIAASSNESIFGQPGLGVAQSHEFTYEPAPQSCYRMAGLTPADVDVLGCYDAFSPQVPWTLERFGFCEPGYGADWVHDGNTALGGKLPTNTSGGHLSEGQLNGWGQIVELTDQLRGRAGQRQVPEARVGQWATTIGDSLIFERHG